MKNGVVKNTLSPNLKRMALNFPNAVVAAMRTVLERKRTIVVRRTPIDLGPLRASVHVLDPERKGRSIKGGIVAGGASAPYAIIQHEDLTLHHDEGQAKYIESVIMEARATLSREIVAELKNESAL